MPWIFPMPQRSLRRHALSERNASAFCLIHSGTVEKGRQQRSRPSGSPTWRSSHRSRSEASTYPRVRLSLLTACGLAGPGSAEAASRRRAPFLNSPCSFCRLRVGVREACYREFFELFNRPIQPEFRSRRCDRLLVIRISLFASAQRRNDEAPSTRVHLLSPG